MLIFHAPYDPNTGRSDDEDSKWATGWVLRAYPLKVREWIIAKGGLTKKALVLKGREMHRRVRSAASQSANYSG